MAHIPDGVLSVPVLTAGGIGAAIAVVVAVRRLDDSQVPRVAILSAMFFVVSLISVPAGPSSVHLLLSALMGLTIGLATFPAVLIGLVLQVLLFGVGGVTTLGVNTLNIALPAVVFGALFLPLIRRLPPRSAAVAGFICAVLSVAGTAGGVALALMLSSSAFTPSVPIIAASYMPLMLAEGLITAFAVGFLKRVRPETLSGPAVNQAEVTS